MGFRLTADQPDGAGRQCEPGQLARAGRSNSQQSKADRQCSRQQSADRRGSAHRAERECVIKGQQRHPAGDARAQPPGQYVCIGPMLMQKFSGQQQTGQAERVRDRQQPEHPQMTRRYSTAEIGYSPDGPCKQAQHTGSRGHRHAA